MLEDLPIDKENSLSRDSRDKAGRMLRWKRSRRKTVEIGCSEIA